MGRIRHVDHPSRCVIEDTFQDKMVCLRGVESCVQQARWGCGTRLGEPLAVFLLFSSSVSESDGEITTALPGKVVRDIRIRRIRIHTGPGVHPHNAH